MLRNNEIIGGIYRIVKELNQGGIGVIYLAEHLRLNKYVVIKKVKDDFNGTINNRNEVDILKNLRHSYLPQVYDYYQEGSQIYTVIDYVEGHDIEWYLNNGYKFDEYTVRKWLHQLCSVVNYLHTHKPTILHSDIKPANIMITSSGDICLIDFNISLDMNKAFDINGFSRNYASPEQYIRYCQLTSGAFINMSCPIDQKTDIYGIGTTFYSIVTHTKPDIVNGQPALSQLSVNYSEGLCRIIEKAMDPDYNRRYSSVKKMLNDIEHIYKLDKSYKKYFICQTAAFIAGVCLIAGGAVSTAKGIDLNRLQSYEKEYKVFCGYYNSGNTEMVQKTGTELVNNSYYSYVYNDDPDAEAEIFYRMADSCYGNEEYERAVDKYRYAIKKCRNKENLKAYYCDYISCLIQAGHIDDAEKAVLICEKYGVKDDEIDFINAELKFKKNTGSGYGEALNIIDSLISSGKLSGKRLYRGYMICADIYESNEEYENELKILDKASEQFYTNAMYRRYGAVYSSMAQGFHNAKKTDYMKKSKDCYKKITDSGSANERDYINLGYVYNGMEVYDQEYLNFMNLAAEKYPEQFRFYMLRALYYHKNDDLKKFKENYMTASRMFGQMSENEQIELLDSEKKLLESERKLYESTSWDIK